jgi:hypothetical protein
MFTDNGGADRTLRRENRVEQVMSNLRNRL